MGAPYCTLIKQDQIVQYINTNINMNINTSSHKHRCTFVYEHISTHMDTLVHDENKETLALLAPPPITRAASTPSSQLSQLQKLYKYTHTLLHIHTHPHTPLFLLTPFPASHGFLQLVLVCPLSAADYCICVCLYVCAHEPLSFIAMVPAECRHLVPTAGPAA